jgi:predicted dehydrogenase
MSTERTHTPAPVHRVLIVGCGNIAGGFDAARPAERLPLTHAGAFSRDSQFRIAACVEPDADRRNAFMSSWAIAEGHATLDALQARAGEFDVISICSPTALHAEHLAGALALRPRLVFCEKPLTPTLRESEAWVQRCDAAGVLLAVNYTRRWAPDVLRLREQLASGALGSLRSIVGHYNKGVLNNGGHMVDLLRLLVGDLTVVAAGRPVTDFLADDPTIPAVLATAAGVPIYLNAAHAADYALFELTVVTSTAVIAMEDAGARWRVRRAVDSANFKGYKTLDAGEQRIGEYDRAMTGAVANIDDALRTGAALASTGQNALAAQRICEQIARLAAAGART